MGHEEDVLDAITDTTIDTTLDAGAEVAIDPHRELAAVLDDLDALLKSGEVIASLTARGINASLAMCAANGLRAYLAGNKIEAAEELGTAAEEIRGRALPELGGPRA